MMSAFFGSAGNPDSRWTAVWSGSAEAGDAAEAAAWAGTNGAALAGLPQTSQSPSTIVPVQPGCIQALMRPPFLVRAIELFQHCRRMRGQDRGKETETPGNCNQISAKEAVRSR
jgi:hypothetical protein